MLEKKYTFKGVELTEQEMHQKLSTVPFEHRLIAIGSIIKNVDPKVYEQRMNLVLDAATRKPLPNNAGNGYSLRILEDLL